jgi:hypothetical protein
MAHHTRHEQPWFKVFDPDARHKYVFVGVLPDSVMSILSLLRTPKDVAALPARTVHHLNAALPGWERGLGLPFFHAHTAITSESQFEPDAARCNHALREAGIASAADFQLRSGLLSDRLTNCGRRVYGTGRDDATSGLTFVPIEVRADDTVQRLKQKLGVATRLPPSHMYLWFDQVVLGFSPGASAASADPRAHPALQPGGCAARCASALASVPYYANESDHLLQDVGIPADAQYSLLTLPALQRSMQRAAARLSVQEQQRLRRQYFPFAKTTAVGSELLSQAEVDDLSASIGHEQRAFDMLFSRPASRAPELFVSSKTSVVIDVPFDGVLVRDSASRGSNATTALEVSRVFEGMDLERRHGAACNSPTEAYAAIVSFVSGRGAPRGDGQAKPAPRARFSKFKVRVTPDLTADSYAGLAKLVAAAQSQHSVSLLLKLRSTRGSATRAETDILLQRSGSYQLRLQFLEDTPLSELTAQVACVASFLRDNISAGDVRFGALPLPDTKFLSTESSTSYLRAMEFAFDVPCRQAFDYAGFSRLVRCLDPFVVPYSDAELLQRLGRGALLRVDVAERLQRKGLSLEKLAELSPRAWSALQLFNNVRENARIVTDLRATVDRLASGQVLLVYRRHSRHDSSNVSKRFVQAQLREMRIGLDDAYHVADVRNRLVRSIIARLHITSGEAQALLERFRDESDMSQPSGILCELSFERGVCEVSVSMHSFVPNEATSQLIADIRDFFSAAIALYADRDSMQRLHCTAGAAASNVADAADDNADVVKLLADFDGSVVSGYEADDYDYDDGDEGEAPGARVAVQEALDSMKADAPEESKPESADAPAAPAADAPAGGVPGSRAARKVRERGRSTKRAVSSNSDYRLTMLQKADPELFRATANRSYAQKCQRRQPVVMSGKEFDAQDKTLFKAPQAMPGGMQYRGQYYICPEIWCRSMRRALHADQLTDAVWATSDVSDTGKPLRKVVAGTCPDGEAAEVANAGPEGWKAEGINQRVPGQGRSQFPGLLRGLAPGALGMPCCFAKDQSVGAGDAALFFQQALLGDPGRGAQAAPAPRAGTMARYVLDSSKFPLEQSRFGNLPARLHRLFNAGAAATPVINPVAFSGCLRLGIPESPVPILTVLLAVLNAGRERGMDIDQFRQNLALHAGDTPLVRSLRDGALQLAFENFGGDDYVANYQDYFRWAPHVDLEWVWDLVSRPLPWLFPDGLNLFVFTSSGGDVKLRCPVEERADALYGVGKPCLFLYAAGDKHYEPIVRVDAALGTQFLFAVTDLPRTYARLVDAISGGCSGQPPDPARTPARIVAVLRASRRAALRPVSQHVGKYNKVRYIETEGGLYVPTAPAGPLFDAALPISSVIAGMTSAAMRHWGEVVAALGAGYAPVRLVKCDAHVQRSQGSALSAVILENGSWAPLRDCMRLDIPVEKSFGIAFFEADDALFADRSAPPTGPELEARRVRFLSETMQRLRLELALFMQASPATMDRLLRLLDAVDPNGAPLPVWAKRSVVFDWLMAKGVAAVVDSRPPKSVTGAEAPGDAIATTTPFRRSCVSEQTAGACSSDPHCTGAAGACRLYVPAQYLERFVLAFVDELLWNVQRRFDLSSRRNGELAFSVNTVRVTRDLLQFDSTTAPFLLDMLRTHDSRQMQGTQMFDVLSAPSDESDMLQRHVAYNIVLRRQQQNAVLRVLRLLPLPPRVALDDTHYLVGNALGTSSVAEPREATPLQRAALLAAYLTGDPTLGEHELRRVFQRDMADPLEPVQRYWSRFAAHMRDIDKSFSGARTVPQLADRFDAKFSGDISVFDALTRVLPIRVLVYLENGDTQWLEGKRVGAAAVGRVFIGRNSNVFLVAKKPPNAPIQLIYAD